MLGRLVVVALLGIAASRRKRPTPPFVAAPELEQAACDSAAAERPEKWDGLRRDPAGSWSTWLGWVAYRRAYPNGPRQPRLHQDANATAWQEALARLTSCVAAKL